jgi:hypothetical protein
VQARVEERRQRTGALVEQADAAAGRCRRLAAEQEALQAAVAAASADKLKAR